MTSKEKTNPSIPNKKEEFVGLDRPRTRSLVNWMEAHVRRKGPLAQIYSRLKASAKDEKTKAEERVMIARAKEVCGPGVSSFIQNVIGDGLTTKDPYHSVSDRLGSACTAAIAVAQQPDEAEVYLQKWEELQPLIGLDIDPKKTFLNFPRYHIGSWRCMYFATMLGFFSDLWKKTAENEEALTASLIKQKYMKEVAWPVAALYREFYECHSQETGGKNNLWLLVDQKIAFLEDEEKAHWRTKFREVDVKDLPGVLANYCLPYFMRELIVKECENSGIKTPEDQWLYTSQNNMFLLNRLIFHIRGIDT